MTAGIATGTEPAADVVAEPRGPAARHPRVSPSAAPRGQLRDLVARRGRSAWPALLVPAASVALAASCGSLAAATGRTGADLLQGCKTAVEGRALDVQAGLCLGVIVTVLDMTQPAVAREPYTICKPPGVSTGQAVNVVLRYMAANPQELDKTLTSIAFSAMQLVWPCGPGKK